MGKDAYTSRCLTSACLVIAALTALGASACKSVLDIDEDRKFVATDGACRGALPVKMLVDLTGSTREVATPYFKGQLDYLRELNEKGGVRGCPVDVAYEDYGYDLARSIDIYEGWRNGSDWPRVSAVFGFGSGDTRQLSQLATQDEKVIISASYLGELASPTPTERAVDVPEVTAAFALTSFNEVKRSAGYPFNFFAGTDYSTGARIAMFHVHAQGGKKIAFFHCSEDYCTGPLAAAKTHARDELQLELGRDLIVELTDSEAEVQSKVVAFFEQELAQAQKDQDYVPVDWVWMGNTTATTAYLGKALASVEQQLDLHIEAIVNNWGFDENLYTACGDACIGRIHGIMPFVAYGDRRAPGMADLVKTHDKWRAREAAEGGPDTTYENVRYVQGYVSALLWKQAVERVIDEGLEVNGLNVKSALESFEQVSMQGLCAPISLSPSDHRPQSTESVYRIGSSGELVHEPPDREIFLDAGWLGW